MQPKTIDEALDFMPAREGTSLAGTARNAMTGALAVVVQVVEAFRDGNAAAARYEALTQRGMDASAAGSTVYAEFFDKT